jgi:NAD(P)-dependent dehydrogenase (short-subunit alcohol dehydrogenase family)
MTTRVALVTGANKGIGLAIVRSLCKQFDGCVYLTARNEDLGKQAVKQLETEGLKPKFHQLDIDSMESIERLKNYISTTHGGLDVLINNAGMAYKTASTAPFTEQATNTVRVNFTGTLNVTRALLPLIRPHGRIVNVSSMASRLSQVSEELQRKFSSPRLTESQLVSMMQEFVDDVAAGCHREKGWSNTAYGMSKVGVTALTKVHALEIAASGREDVLINSCCPGWVRTDMAGDKAPLSPNEGAETPVFLALLPAGSPSGEFWKEKKIAVW